MNAKVIGVIAIVLVAIGGIFYLATRYPSVSTLSTKAPISPPLTAPLGSMPALPTSTVTPSQKIALKSQPGTVATITNVAMSRSITARGAAVAPKTVFSSADPVIYAVLSLQNATQRTELSYVRYYAGKYVDSKVSHPTKDGVQYFHFDWTLKPGQTRKTGNYTLNFYVNGEKAKRISYSIQ